MKNENYKSKKNVAFSIGLAALCLLVATANSQAQPCPETNGVKVLFPPQTFYGGLDVKDSRQSIVLADDFPCTNGGMITDIHLWGSWSNNVHGTITNFWLGIYNDTPAYTNYQTSTVYPSHPGTNLLWQQSFPAGQFYEMQVYFPNPYEFFYNPVSGSLDFETNVWYYCFYPTNPFVQQGSINQPTNYWLAAQAQLMPGEGTYYGWKTSISNYNDAAVWDTVGADGLPKGNWLSMTNPVTLTPVNLSFKLTTATENCCPDIGGVKYEQDPDLNNGVDWTACWGWVLADDFPCTNTGPITDIHLWGSWAGDWFNTNAVFVLGIWSDVPTNTSNPYSHPGTNLWYQVYSNGQYTICGPTYAPEYVFSSTMNYTNRSTNLYYLCFNVDPTNPFTQRGTIYQKTNYWLSVTVQLANGLFGWKSSTNAYNDDAVGYWGPALWPTNGWNPISDKNGNSLKVNLAFKITGSNNPCLPQIGCPDDKLVQCTSNWSFDPITVSTNPCCGTNPPIFDYTYATNILGPCKQIFTRNSTILDCNFSLIGVCTQNVTVMDTNPPVFSGCVTSKTVQCGSNWWFDIPTASYVCSGSNAVVGVVGMTNYNLGTCTNVQITTWAATNECSGAAATCSEVVTIIDTTPPIITYCPSNLTVYTCSNIVETWTITATDTCSSVTVTSTPPSGTVFGMNTINPVVVTASDACGNKTNCSFTITVLPGAGCQCVETNGVKFLLLPNTQSGLDVKDSRDNIVLADDFYCATPGPITDIHLWGSWLSDQHGMITNFWIGIYNDVPAVTNTGGQIITPSHPGTNLLWQQSFAYGQYAESIYTNGYEHFYNPTNNQITGSDTLAWYYCFYPTNPFVQHGTTAAPTNYWLAVRAQLANDGTMYGWKTSISNYHDAAVWGTVGASGLPSGNWQSMTNPDTGQPIDLSFKLTTPPVVCVESDYEKYVQWPNIIGGYDVWNNPYVLADDFVCTNAGPISDIHLWGSWQYDQPLTNSITFWLGIYNDMPTNASNPFSHPGTNLLWQQWFTPGQYAETIWTASAQEYFLDPGPTNIIGGDSVVWYYCFYPTNAFQQLGTPTNSKTYWLAAYAQLPAGTQYRYGWKTTTNVLHDVSVHAFWPGSAPTNNPGWIPTYIVSTPLDLAFKLTSCGPVFIKRLAPTNVVITWPGGGYLQSATNVTGPYIDVPGFPPSPYTDSTVIPPTNRFYRLRCY